MTSGPGALLASQQLRVGGAPLLGRPKEEVNALGKTWKMKPTNLGTRGHREMPTLVIRPFIVVIRGTNIGESGASTG